MISLLVCLFVINHSLIMVRAEWNFSTVNINVSDSCEAAIQRLSELEVSDAQLMAYYWDSWGKPSDDILTGHTTFLGYYDECIDLKNTALGETKYCIYSMIMESNTLLTNAADSSKDICSSNECPALVNMSSVTDIKMGICYPSQCSSSEFATVLSTMAITNIATMITPHKIYSYTIKLKSTNDSAAFCPDTDVELDTGAVAVIVICGVLIGLVIVGTTMDYLLLLSIESPTANKAKIVQTTVNMENTDGNDDPHHSGTQKTVKDFMLSFSLYNTVPKLISTKQSPSTINPIPLP